MAAAEVREVLAQDFISPGLRESGGGSEPVGDGGGDRGHNICRKAFVKKWRVACSYVLGEDIRWSQIVQMASLTVVGKMIGKNVSLSVIENWVKTFWAENLGEIPELEGLTRGSFTLNFT